uniref:Uncharacterized protein n=1 Tax=Panagrolaimus davidi TaxID=227884 RepID=A0A914QJF7_9BILA
MSSTDSTDSTITVSKVCQKLADLFQAPVMYSLDIYEINLPYDEFHKRVMSDANVRVKLQRIRRNSSIPRLLASMATHDPAATIRKVCKQLADIFQVPVMHSFGIYEINMPYEEFHKRAMNDFDVRMRFQRLRSFSITASGYWDHLSWHNIKTNNFDYALPKI